MPVVTVLVIAAYGLSSLLYLAFLAGLPSRLTGYAGYARGVLAVGALLQVADIGLRCLKGQHPVSSTPEAVAFLAWLIVVGFILSTRRYHLEAAGAFAVPAALALLVLSRVSPQPAGTPAMGPLGQTHILMATLGVAIFAMAAALAVLYLVEDRQLRRKKFRRLLLGRGAPLDTLDRLASRCVSVGFPVFTVALVTGAAWIARLGGLWRLETLRFEYVWAVVTWLAFGVLLVARFGAGWRGRRAAWLTLGGFGGAVLVLMGYFLRHAV